MEIGSFWSPDLEEYLLAHTTKEDEVLYELNRHTHLNNLQPRMLSGPIQGKFLEFLVRLAKPKKVLEIGTFTGYSAICIAKGLDSDGQLHTIEINDEITDTPTAFFQKAGLSSKIIQHVGNALDIIPKIDEIFDIVLIDGDKRQYPDYLNVVLPKLKVGGLIIADNVLWDGKVLKNIADDAYTKGVKNFNSMVANDKRLEQVILPMRDGIMLISKIMD